MEHKAKFVQNVHGYTHTTPSSSTWQARQLHQTYKFIGSCSFLVTGRGRSLYNAFFALHDQLWNMSQYTKLASPFSRSFSTGITWSFCVLSGQEVGGWAHFADLNHCARWAHWCVPVSLTHGP